MRPVSAGDSRTGSVTSTVSVLSRASSAAPFNASRRAAIAAVTRSFKPLISGPCSLRCSGVMPPSVLSSADTEPLLPSAPTRTASSAASSDAPAMALRICGSSVAISLIGSLRQSRQICRMRLAAGLRQHAVYLPAMVRLMIEHVRDELPSRLGEVAFHGARIVSEVAVQPGGIKPIRPHDHRLIERGALAPQSVPVGIHRDRLGNAALRPRNVGEPAHPDAIAPQQMAQRLVNRAEKCAALASALLVA